MPDHDPNSPDEQPTSFDTDGSEATRAAGADDTAETATSGGGAPPPPSLKRLGDFELLRELGRGGMGVVYEARQVSLKRRVALKVLPPALGISPQAKQRFEREAQAAAKLHHTNIVPVHAIGEHDGHHFYAMDLIEGQSLDHVLRDVANQGSNPLLDQTVTRAASELPQAQATASDPAPVTSSNGGSVTSSLGDTSAGSRPWFDAVAKLIAEVADGLDYAHGRGVIHRDIKPANLMLSGEGRLCITDFGLARIVQEPGMTVSGSFLGTPAYMSPEQIAAGRMKLDHRTDVYSLGAVLYEMLTLQRPFPGDSREEVIGAIMTKEPRPPRKLNGKIPQDLETICLKALEKDPDRRYATAGEYANDLRQYLQRGLITARRANIAQRTWKSIRRRPTMATAIALTIVAIVIVSAVLWIAGERSTAAEVERLLLEGRIALEAGKYREGMNTVDRALSIDPQSDQARFLKAKFLTYAGNRRMVLDEARARLERDPDDWVSHMIMAFAASAWLEQDYSVDIRKHVEALEDVPESADLLYLRAMVADSPQQKLNLLDRALELEPNHAHALEARLGLLVWVFADLKEAMRLCERFIVARPRSELGYTLKAFVLGESGDYEGVMEALERAVEVDPDESHVYWTRALIRSGFGEYREAILDFTKAIELRPNHSRLYKHRAQTYALLKAYDNVIADARSAIEINPNYPENWAPLLTGLIATGAEDQIRAAAEELRGRVELLHDPSARASAFDQLSRAHKALEDYQQAVSDAERAIELDPNGIDGYVNRIEARRQLKIDEPAREDCARLATLDVEWVAYDLMRVAVLASICSSPEQALQASTHIISRAPEYWRGYYHRGDFNTQLGHFKEALADYEKSVEVAPRSAIALNGYARALLTVETADLRNPDKALKVALQANEITGSKNANDLDTLALAYHMTGGHENAIATERKAISVLRDDRYREKYEKRLAEFEAALRDEE